MEPRNYQLELFELAKKNNSIVFLGTGSGKTFISIMMIKDFFCEAQTHKRKIIMVVPSIPLVNQQCRVIDDHCKFARVGKLSGEDGVDLWDSVKWKSVLDSLDIIVIIHQVLLDALVHNYISLAGIQLLIFDECHHTFKDNPYNMIMKEHYFPLKATNPSHIPHIMGLSASIVLSQCDNELKFLKEKKLLEKNMDAKVITTKDLDNYLKFVTQPVEIQEGYSEPILSGDISEIIDKGINDLEKVYDQHIIDLLKLIGESKSKMCQAREKALSKKKQFAKILNDSLMLVNTLGIVGSSMFINYIIDESLSRTKLLMEQKYEIKFIEVVDKTLRATRIIFESQMSSFQGSELKRIQHFMSPRVHRLLKVFSDFVNDEKFCRSSFTCIVFVQRRETARILCSLLKQLKQLDSSLSYLSPSYVVSQNMNDLNRGLEEMKKTDETIRKFRYGDYNLVIATSILEEGIDLKKCNLVIRFDDIQTFRSYVQSKGRARRKPSRFIVMYSLGQVRSFEEKMANFQKLENMSIEQCHTVPLNGDRLQDLMDEEADDEEEEEPYFVSPQNKENSPMVSPATAISLLYQYISSITTDKFTTLVPFWEFAMTTSRPHNLLFSMLEEPKYVCRVTLPHKTPLTAPVQGTLQPSRKKAKRSAALKACSILHQMGEFDDQLIPRMKNLVQECGELNDGLDDDDEGAKPGTRRFRRYYAQKRLLLNCSPVLRSSRVFIYEISMRLLNVRKHNPKRYSIYDPQENPRKLGLCLVEPLSDILLSNNICLYSRSGLIDVTISLFNSQYSGPGLLEKCEGLSTLMKFTTLIYKDVLKVATPWMNELSEENFLSCRDPLVIPLLNGDVDVECILSSISGEPFIHGDLTERVVTLLHKNDPQRYFVEDVVQALSPSSMLDDTMTFAEHYFRKYGLKVTDMNQPLIRLSNADSEFFAFSNSIFDEKDNKLLELTPEDFIRTRCLAIPELVRAHSVPASLWKDLQILPYIMVRVNQILNSIELFRKLCPLQKRVSYPVNIEPSFESLIDLEVNFSGISSNFNHYELFKSITLTNAGEEFDLERNEILGDSFLKIMTSIYLYFEIKLKDEGYLSFYRSKIVGNRNLLRIGEIFGSLNLGGILNAVKLQPKYNWQVPFYDNCKRLEEEIVKMNNKYRKDLISSKLPPNPLNFVDVLDENLLNELRGLVYKNDSEGLSRFYRAIVAKLSKPDDKTGKSPMMHLRVYVAVADKSIADAVESIIGVYLLHNGCKATLQMMASTLGINLYPNVSVEKNICGDSRGEGFKTWYTSPKDAVVTNSPYCHGALNRLLIRLQCKRIEEKIGYTFREKTFLLQAFTHSSFVTNNITDSYERLEFLGDAVLDYLVSAYIFTEYPNYGPGKVTDARSAVVNNVTLALITLRSQLHCHLLHSEPLLLSKIDSTIDCVNIEQSEGSEFDMIEMKRSLLGETECPVLEEVEVPKVLGDIVEALLGAIFLDSGLNLKTVWEVFRRLCPQLDSLIIAKPKNYVAKLYELYPSRIVFGPSKALGNQIVKTVTLTMNNGEIYQARGIGPKGKVAKNSAAKCLIRSLVKIKELPPGII